ncbi:MAG TPA: family 20 glycosylhydrolase [Saprospiraceae bacterium]|nr:beta-N-acetylhexosaminidase [Saprospirales bacterium]HRQ28512.1 family 20 glycosylhydrolase [Saprospiraceae bacterium]
MRNLIIFIAAFFLIISACQPSFHPAVKDIFITWEVLSNTYKEIPGVKARFVIENKGRIALDDQNWSLYFNQSPREVIATNSPQPVKIERISGDWYRLVPLKGFNLQPYEKLEIVYENGHWWVSLSDAPAGLYFVFKNDEGKEHIQEVFNYTILPFNRAEQTTKHLGDYFPNPTPEYFYQQYQGISKIDDDLIPPIVPRPQKFNRSDEKISFGPSVHIHFPKELKSEADYLATTLESLTGIKPDLNPPKSLNGTNISLQLADPDLFGDQTEAYHLTISKNGELIIEGSGNPGVFYGIQSLIALLPVEEIINGSKDLSVPVCHIEDAPRFKYRGMHLDVARHFFEKKTILKYLDILSFYKVNTLHLHLTEDEGWRLEIPALPELTGIGGRRGHTTKDAPFLHPSYGSGPFAEVNDKAGSGYYTRKDFIEILKYAHKRHIQIIPEINMPGHSRAAIKAMEHRYRELMKQGKEQEANAFRLIDPEDKSVYNSAQHYNDNVVNVARESVYKFYETVLDAVLDMYKEAGVKIEIWHVGGDEVPRGAWTASPMIDSLLKRRPELGKPHNMHAYFHGRIKKLLDKRNLKTAGWEEIGLIADADGKNIPNKKLADGNVIPYVWNNLWGAQDLAYRLANAGFPVVLSHVTNFYFDLAYNNDPRETGLSWGGYVDEFSAWHYNPYDVFKTTIKDNLGKPFDLDQDYKNMVRLKPEAKKNIFGVQAQMWTETVSEPEKLEYYLLPKLIGFAETAWASERIWEKTEDHLIRQRQVKEGWNIFTNQLSRYELPRLSILFGGYNYRIPPPGAQMENGILRVNTAYPGLEVRYTTDGSEPDRDDPVVEGPVKLKTTPVIIKAFDPSGKSGFSLKVRNKNR